MRERSFFERQWLSAVSVLAVPALPHSAPLSGHCEHSWRQWWFCKGRQTCCLWTRLSKKRLGGFVPSHFNQQQSWWHQGKRWFYPHHGWVLQPNVCILGSIENLQQSHWEYSKIYINITFKSFRGFASLMFDYVTGPRRICNTDDLPSPLVDQLVWPQGTPGGLYGRWVPWVLSVQIWMFLCWRENPGKTMGLTPEYQHVLLIITYYYMYFP